MYKTQSILHLQRNQEIMVLIMGGHNFKVVLTVISSTQLFTETSLFQEHVLST